MGGRQVPFLLSHVLAFKVCARRNARNGRGAAFLYLHQHVHARLACSWGRGNGICIGEWDAGWALAAGAAGG